MQQAFIDNQLQQVHQSFESAVEELKGIVSVPIAEQETALAQVKQISEDMLSRASALQQELDAHQSALQELSSRGHAADVVLRNSVDNAEQKVKLALQILDDFKSELLDGQEIKFGIERQRLLQTVEQFISEEQQLDARLFEDTKQQVAQLQQTVEESVAQMGQQSEAQAAKLETYAVTFGQLQENVTLREQEEAAKLGALEQRCTEIEANADRLQQNQQRETLALQQKQAELQEAENISCELISTVERDCSENLTSEANSISQIRKSEENITSEFATLRTDFLQIEQPAEDLHEKVGYLSKVQQLNEQKLDTVAQELQNSNADILQKLGEALEWQAQNQFVATQERDFREEIKEFVQEQVQNQLAKLFDNDDALASTRILHLISEAEERVEQQVQDVQNEVSALRRSFDEKMAVFEAKFRDTDVQIAKRQQESTEQHAANMQATLSKISKVVEQNNSQMLQNVELRVGKQQQLVKDAVELMQEYKAELTLLEKELDAVKLGTVVKEDIQVVADSVNNYIQATNGRVKELEQQGQIIREEQLEIGKSVQKDEQQFRNQVLEQLVTTNKQVKLEVMEILKEEEEKRREELLPQAIDSAVSKYLESTAKMLREQLIDTFNEKLSILQSSLTGTQRQFEENAAIVRQQLEKVDKIMTGFARDNQNLENEKTAIENVFVQAENEIKTEFVKYKEAITLLEMKIEQGSETEKTEKPNESTSNLQKQMDELESRILPLLLPNEAALPQYAELVQEVEEKKKAMLDMLLQYQDSMKAYVEQQRRELEEAIAQATDQNIALVAQVSDRNAQIMSKSLPETKLAIMEAVAERVLEVRTENESFYNDFVQQQSALQVDYKELRSAVLAEIEKPLIQQALFDQIHERIEEAAQLAREAHDKVLALHNGPVEAHEAAFTKFSEQLAQLEREDADFKQRVASCNVPSCKDATTSGGDAIDLEQIDERIETRLLRFEATSETAAELRRVAQGLLDVRSGLELIGSNENDALRQFEAYLTQAIDYRDAAEQALHGAKEDLRAILNEMRVSDAGKAIAAIEDLRSAVQGLNLNEIELETEYRGMREYLSTGYLAEHVKKPLLLLQSDILGLKEQVLNDLVPAALAQVRDKLVSQLNSTLQDAFNDAHTALAGVEQTKADMQNALVCWREEQRDHVKRLDAEIEEQELFSNSLKAETDTFQQQIRLQVEQLQVQTTQNGVFQKEQAVQQQQSTQNALSAYEDIIKQYSAEIQQNFDQTQTVFTENVRSAEERLSLQQKQFTDAVSRKVDGNMQEMLNYEQAQTNQRDHASFMLDRFSEILNQENEHFATQVQQLVERVEGASSLKHQQNSLFREEISAQIADIDARQMGLLQEMESTLSEAQNASLAAVANELEKYAAKYSGLCEDLHLLRADVTTQMAAQLALLRQHQKLADDEESTERTQIQQIREQMAISAEQAQAALLATAQFEQATTEINGRFQRAIAESVAALDAERQKFLETNTQLTERVRAVEDSTGAFQAQVKADICQLASKEVASLSMSAKQQQSAPGVEFVRFEEFDRVDNTVRKHIRKLITESEQRGLHIRQCRIIRVKPGTYEVNYERVSVEIEKGELAAQLPSGQRVEFLEWLYDRLVQQ